MRFKTVIKIVSDAKDKSEALDLVEDYLSGNISSGVDMKCATRPVYSAAKMAGVAAISLVAIIGIIFASNIKHPQDILQRLPGVSAVQPPLKTSSAAKTGAEFKKEWQDRQTKEALDRITR